MHDRLLHEDATSYSADEQVIATLLNKTLVRFNTYMEFQTALDALKDIGFSIKDFNALSHRNYILQLK